MNARSSVILSAERGLSCIVGWLLLVEFNGVYGLNRRRAWRKTAVMTGVPQVSRDYIGRRNTVGKLLSRFQ